MTKLQLLEEIAINANEVMECLEEYGASIVPHLMDTDENSGERLRQLLKELKEFE